MSNETLLAKVVVYLSRKGHQSLLCLSEVKKQSFFSAFLASVFSRRAPGFKMPDDRWETFSVALGGVNFFIHSGADDTELNREDASVK